MISLELKHLSRVIQIAMSVVQDIQTVRSLRKEIRDINLPSNITKSIETIHSCLQTGTDLNGWKKVNWRNSATADAGAGGVGGRSYGNDRNDNFRSHNSHNNSKGNGFFRGSNSNSEPSNSAFSSSSSSRFGRNSSAYSGGGHQQSFPLAGGNARTETSPRENNRDNHRDNHRDNQRDNSNSNFTPTPYAKYVSKFKKESDTVDDTIINTILLGKLNKMSIANYDEIKEFITHIIDSDQTEMTKCFMRLVFQKATVEEIFCPLYAKLLSELSSRYPVLLTEMANLYNSYMTIFEEVDETDEKNYTDLVKRNVEKKYRRGYSQFLAELIKHGVINTENFIKTVNTIVKQIENNCNNSESTKLIEDYTDCLIRIINAIKTDNREDEDEDDNIEEIKETIKKDVYNRIKPFSIKNPDNKGISTKARFGFLNMFEDIEKF